MAASAAQIAQLRRMVAEPTTAVYDDAALAASIVARPIDDELGRAPTSYSWTPTYDLNAAAADLWDEKAAAVAGQFDVNADGASLRRSQKLEQYQKMAQHYRSRSAIGTVIVRQEPDPRKYGDLVIRDSVVNDPLNEDERC